MAESLFSPLWYRVAALQPRLGQGVTARRQQHRDETWHVLVNSVSARQFRINARAYRFLGCCDGQRTVQQIWDALLESMHDDAPTQDEVVRLITQLGEAALLEVGTGQDFGARSDQSDARRRRRNGFPNPLAFKIKLGDPSRLLRALDPLAAWMFHPLVLVLWLGAVGLACVSAASRWDELTLHAVNHMGTPHYLFLAWISYPFIKALHELGHALAVRHWHGEVHEAGVGLFVLTPAPYVDASASAAFRRRHQRAAVAGMGIMVEFALAAFALLLWLNLQSGTLRDLAFVTMVVCSVSTVAFNANPLMQFDGYHVLCDALDLPGLATRSRRYWTHLLQQLAFGQSHAPAMRPLAGERRWLLAYAPLAWTYRVVISIAIVLWVGNWSLVLGVLVAAWVLASAVLLPAAGLVRGVLRAAAGAPQRRRARLAVVAAGCGLVLLCGVVPVPFRTAAWGVVWLPEQARARPETEGFITSFAARDGQRVVPGQLLLTLDDPALFAQREKLQNQLVGVRADRFDSLQRDTLKVSNLEEEARRIEGDLRRIEERIGLLEVRSASAGRLALPNQDDLLGTFVKRGATLGFILDGREIGVRAAVPERDAALIRQGRGKVEVRLAEAVPASVVAGLVREVPAAVHELPSPALGDRGGGPYATDPADRDGVRSIEPVVLVDLALPDRALERVGGRVWVRFDHGTEPLAMQSWRRLRQLFLQHFNPTG